MTNPYAPPPIFARQGGEFHLKSTVHAAGNSMKVGLLCGIASGILLELGLRLFPRLPLMWQFAGPGLVFGLGVMYAAWRAVPQSRKALLAVFPFFALTSFAVVGMMYTVGIQPPTGRYFAMWANLSWFSLPGVLILALGCLLVARPRSYVRLILFIIANTLIVGGAPVIAELVLVQQEIVPIYFSTMFVAQTLMFAMIGWNFGDSISNRPIHSKETDQQEWATQA